MEDTTTSLGDDGSSSEDDTSQSGTELMVTSRSRRATAGNRYNALISQEEIHEDEEDEINMLFAEAEGEDDDFNSDDGDDDADMSSSDDDDQGPNTAADNMDGEKELEREAKVERAKKRKADLALTTMAGLKKKPRIDPTALRRAPAPKPTKRKERISWMPDSNNAPGRTSLRKQTILHRAETHAKLKENEEQRLKMKAKREKREREREAEAPKEMTQEDRLAEAERVERRNAKSLNRWEALEKKRAEEQAAKLAALKERKLEGAVITWHSSSAKYYGLKETKEVEYEPPPEAKKRGRKPKALLEQLAAARLAASGTGISPPIPKETNGGSKNTISLTPSVLLVLPGSSESPGQSPISQVVVEKNQDHVGVTTVSPNTTELPTRFTGPGESKTAFLTGIHEYASMIPDSKTKSQPEEADSNPNSNDDNPLVDNTKQTVDKSLVLLEEDLAQSESNKEQSKLHAKQVEVEMDVMSGQPAVVTKPEEGDKPIPEVPESSDMALETTNVSNVDVGMTQSDSTDMALQVNQDPELEAVQSPTANSIPFTPVVENEQVVSHSTPDPAEASNEGPAIVSAEPQIEIISTRNLLVLDKFDELTDQGRQDFSIFYNNRKSSKLVKHNPELCSITGLPVRYRDPATRIGYANAVAYKKLQELKVHQFVWSTMLGCYVGRSKTAARGVPEGFLR